MQAKLREVRLKNNLSQKKISEMLNLSESYYCQLETGARRMSLQVARDIALLLEVSLDDLFMSENLAFCKESDG